jgi:hypothetical protein
MITETDQLTEALAQAERIWPELAGQKTLLLRKLLEVGITTIERESAERSSQRLTQIQKLAGSMDSTWPSNWKQELGGDWPK